ncbi:MAG TPA: hypothetical protein PKL96_05375 [Bacteroidales bacterium]|nr:hypothetical protein [Bacteroidales bacterium]HPS26989.1 hypothetical protein [Bacteroidales bacterium]
MKTLKLFAMILFIGIIAASCTKEGPEGPQGAAGTNGTDGNANVRYFGFGPTIFTSTQSENHFFLHISDGTADSSLILPYYYSNSFWYQVGEIGWGANYLSRYYYLTTPDSTRLNCQVRNIDGSAYTGADVTWDSIKVLVIPANVFRSAKADDVNFNDYKQLNTYLSEKR